MNKTNPTMIGAFVLGALGLLVAIIVLFGGGGMFEARTPVVMYFPGSIQGLRAGSSIMFRGVAIGTIREIDVVYDTDRNDIVIPVHGELVPRNLVTVGSAAPPPPLVGGHRERMRFFIEQGLRAQLSLPNVVTNQVNVTVDFYPGARAVATTDPADRGVLEIPTVPSPIEEVSATVQNLIKKLSTLPLDDVLADSRSLLQGASNLVNDPRLPQIVARVDDTLAALNEAAGAIDTKLEPILTTLDRTSRLAEMTVQETRARLTEGEGTLQGMKTVFDDAGRLITTAQALIEPGSPLSYELVIALQEITATARSARSLINTLERNPNALLVGRETQGGGP